MTEVNKEKMKVTLLAEKCLIIKIIIVDPKDNNKVKDTLFLESYKCLNRSPAHATIFQTENAAEAMIWVYNSIWKQHAPKGRADGYEEIIDFVSYYDEIVNGPYGQHLKIDKDGSIKKVDRDDK